MRGDIPGVEFPANQTSIDVLIPAGNGRTKNVQLKSARVHGASSLRVNLKKSAGSIDGVRQFTIYDFDEFHFLRV